MSELVLNRRYTWDPRSLAEIDEAKSIFMDFKRQGHLITRIDGETVLDRFIPSLCEFLVKAEKIVNKSVMKILCKQGDDRIVWDKDNGPEALLAKDKFKELLKKGYMAYSVDSKGKKNRPIEEFDVDAEEILMVPPTSAG